jgi:uncharacterized membrane protein YfcA
VLEGLAKRLSLHGSYAETDASVVNYNATVPKRGLVGMFAAGLIFGLLGIGNGTFNVLSMDLAMKLPMKVSTTLNLLHDRSYRTGQRGNLLCKRGRHPFIVAPVAIGILTRAFVGTRLLVWARNPKVRKIFAVVLAATAIEIVQGVWNVIVGGRVNLRDPEQMNDALSRVLR